MAALLHDIVIVCHRCHRGQAPVLRSMALAMSKELVAWLSISIHACGSVPIVKVLHLAELPDNFLCSSHLSTCTMHMCCCIARN